MEVTKKLKTLLNILNPFFSKMDCEITFDVEAYNHQVNGGNYVYCSGGRVALPIDISKELDNFMESISSSLDQEIDDSEVYRYEIKINPENRTVEVFAHYTVYGQDGPYEEEMVAQESCDKFKAEGAVDTVHFDFSGGGDSGYVEDTGYDSKDNRFQLFNEAENDCYHILGNFGGWEINEGSSGFLVFHVNEGKLTLEFTWNTEEVGEELQGTWTY